MPHRSQPIPADLDPQPERLEHGSAQLWIGFGQRFREVSEQPWEGTWHRGA
jgi:hypothetical protein